MISAGVSRRAARKVMRKNYAYFDSLGASFQ